jgi:hypothetical protein
LPKVSFFNLLSPGGGQGEGEQEKNFGNKKIGTPEKVFFTGTMGKVGIKKPGVDFTRKDEVQSGQGQLGT